MPEPNKTNDSSSHPAVAGATVATVNSKEEHAYWRENFAKQPYAELSRSYSDYAPAYQYGWESQGRMTGKSFDQAEVELAGGWNKVKGTSVLGWDKAQAAARDGWNRIERVLPDGR